MEEDLALFAIDHAKKLGAEYADARLEGHCNELITVATGKIQRAMINHKRGIGIRTLVKGTCYACLTLALFCLFAWTRALILAFVTLLWISVRIKAGLHTEPITVLMKLRSKLLFLSSIIQKPNHLRFFPQV